jgi:hypothetical protein
MCIIVFCIILSLTVSSLLRIVITSLHYHDNVSLEEDPFFTCSDHLVGERPRVSCLLLHQQRPAFPDGHPSSHYVARVGQNATQTYGRKTGVDIV